MVSTNSMVTWGNISFNIHLEQIRKESVNFKLFSKHTIYINYGILQTMSGKCPFCETPCGNDHCPYKED